MPRLYLFPTGNAFHGSCLCAEVAALAPPQQRARIHKLVDRLARVSYAYLKRLSAHPRLI